MKKALFLLSTLEIGGSETKVVRLVNALSKRGLPVEIAYLNGPITLLRQLDSAIQVTFLDRRGKVSVPAMSRLNRRIRGADIGTIVSINLYPSLYASAATLFVPKPSIRNVIAVNTMDLLGARDRAQMVLYERLLRRADHVVFGCRSQLDMWCRQYKVDRNRCSVVYNGVDTARFTPGACSDGADRLRRQLGLNPGDFVVGTVGQMRPEKAQGHLLEVLARVKNRVPNVRGLIVGDGPMRSRLEMQLEALGLSGRVALVGELEDVRPALELMDVFVLCSVAVETFSNAALEAMATGIPVVLSDIGGAREMIHNSLGGQVFSRGDLRQLEESLLSLAADPGQREVRGREAREVVESRFGFDRMVSQYESLLWGNG